MLRLHSTLTQRIAASLTGFNAIYSTIRYKLTSMGATPELDMDWIHPWIGLDWVRWLQSSVFCSFIYFLY